MKAILSRISVQSKVLENRHPITMIFTKVGDDLTEYPYKTNVETQLGLSLGSIADENLQTYLDTIESNKGKVHDINLYDISFSEMTNGKYKGYKYDSSHNPNKVYYDFHVATYKNREDAIFDRIHVMCILCLQGDIVGVKENGKEEKINDPKGLFFDDSDKYTITIDMLSSVTTDFIINKADLSVIRAGEILVNKDDFSNCRVGYTLVQELKKYREKRNEVERKNSSFIKKISFWEDPEPLPKLNVSEKELILLKILYLNQTKFPEKCREIQKKNLDSVLGVYSDTSDEFNDFLTNEVIKRLKKYSKHLRRIKVLQ